MQAWNLYEKGELSELVDSLLNEDLDLDEACKFLMIALLCTQDMPKLRPAMSTVVEMLSGEVELDKTPISKPGLLSEFMEIKDGKGDKEKGSTKDSTCTGSADSGKTSSFDVDTSIATMTFNSIYDRSN